MAVEQAHRDRTNPGPTNVLDTAGEIRGAELGHDLAVGPDPLAHGEAQVTRNQRRRWRPIEVVEARAGTAPELQHVAETGRGHQTDARLGLLEDRVSGDRRAVHETGDAATR